MSSRREAARQRARMAWLGTVVHVRRVVEAVVVGVLGGLTSTVFLRTLSWATRTRLAHGWLLWLLPVAGLAVGLLYHHGGGRAAGGNTLIFGEIHEPVEHLPRRLAPLIFGATITTHLFGGSAGREGVALQMAAGATDIVARLAKWSPARRQGLLVVALAAGFAAVFGTPIAGALFALEVPRSGRLRSDALLPCVAAALVGSATSRALGIHHDTLPTLASFELTFSSAGRLLVLGIGCGLVALAYVTFVDAVKHLAHRVIAWAPLRPALGGVAVIALVGLAGTRDYLGLSVPLSDAAVTGAHVVAAAFAWKLVFTAVTLGSGLQGGEVTPLFVMGSTFGAAVCGPLSFGQPLAAGLGFVAVFGAAANTPLACTVLAVELFGGNALVPAAIVCVVATLASGRRSIYAAQRTELLAA
jgi:H+/Cl- antiporter ClcA